MNNLIPAEGKDSDIEVIRRWYTSRKGKVELSDAQIKKRDLYTQVWTLLCSFNSPKQVAEILQKPPYGKSQATAYKYIRETTELYGDVVKIPKESKRMIVSEWITKAIQLAFSQKPPNLEMVDKLIGKYIKNEALDTVEPNTPSAELLKQHIMEVHITADQAGFNKIPEFEKTKSEYLKKYAGVEVEDTDFEEM